LDEIDLVIRSDCFHLRDDLSTITEITQQDQNMRKTFPNTGNFGIFQILISAITVEISSQTLDKTSSFYVLGLKKNE
jgi:hypothetical protein